MNIETVDKIMELMRAGKTQREAQDELGISYTTIGRVAKENGFKVDKAKQNKEGQLKSEKNLDRWAKMTQMSLWNRKPKAGNIKAVPRVTTSHIRLPQPEKWSGENFIMDAY